MASYRGVQGVMAALESYLQRRLPAEWQGGTVNAQVRLLGSVQLAQALAGNLVGVYLHRISLDPYGRNRTLPPSSARAPAPHAELPVNLHVLVIANGASASIEADLMAWAMVELASQSHLDLSQVADSDPDWTSREQIAITPEEIATEDLLRLWDRFEASYTLTTAYVLRSVRLRLGAEETVGPSVVSRVFPTGVL